MTQNTVDPNRHTASLHPRVVGRGAAGATTLLSI